MEGIMHKSYKKGKRKITKNGNTLKQLQKQVSTVISLFNEYVGKWLYFTLNEHYEKYTIKLFILL
jgi:hypothetical protein